MIAIASRSTLIGARGGGRAPRDDDLHSSLLALREDLAANLGTDAAEASAALCSLIFEVEEPQPMSPQSKSAERERRGSGALRA